jgi:hypothetical protein
MPNDEEKKLCGPTFLRYGGLLVLLVLLLLLLVLLLEEEAPAAAIPLLLWLWLLSRARPMGSVCPAAVLPGPLAEEEAAPPPATSASSDAVEEEAAAAVAAAPPPPPPLLLPLGGGMRGLLPLIGVAAVRKRELLEAPAPAPVPAADPLAEDSGERGEGGTSGTLLAWAL